VDSESFDEAPIPKELQKDHKQVKALADIETKIDNIDAGWRR